MVLQGIVWIKPPPFPKGGEGGFKKKDATKGMSLRVIRFSDKEIFNDTQGVLERIWGYL
jgi:hypothetical protein